MNNEQDLEKFKENIEIDYKNEVSEDITNFEEDLKDSMTEEELNDFINKSISDEDINTFNLPELSEEDASRLSKEEIIIYNAGRQLSLESRDHSKESNTDIYQYKEFISDEIVNDMNSDNMELKKQSEELAKAELIYKAYSLYMSLEEQKFTEESEAISKKTYPSQISKHYFDGNNKLYGYNEDTGEIEPYEPSPDAADQKIVPHHGQENIRKAYKDTIELTRLIDIVSDANLNLNQLKKFTTNDIRYKRTLDTVNTYIRYRLERGKEKNTTSCADEIPTYIKRLIINSHSVYKNESEEIKTILSRSLIYALSVLCKKTTIDNYESIFYAYNVNMNLYILNYNGTIDLEGARKTLFNSLYKFIDIVYKRIK